MTALRSFKTEKSVSSSGAPRYWPPTFVASLIPSAFSTSSAYFASSIAFETSGRGRAAQNMNLPGCSFLMRAAASLVCLTVWADVGCGAASVSTEVSTPASSIHFRWLYTSYFGRGNPSSINRPSFSSDDTNSGVMRWLCTSITPWAIAVVAKVIEIIVIFNLFISDSL